MWTEERRVRAEPFWFVECLISKDLLCFIQSRLGYKYDIDSLEVGPDDLGHPIRRPRMWVSGLLRGSLTRLRPLRGLLGRMRREVVAPPDIYYAMQGKAAQDHIDALGRASYAVAGDGQQLAFEDTLAEGNRARFEEYMQLREPCLQQTRSFATSPTQRRSAASTTPR